MLNQQLSISDVRRLLDRGGPVQVPGFLEPEMARSLLACLDEEVPWTLAIHDQQQDQSRTIPVDEYQAMDETERRALLDRVARESVDRYGFAYESFQMIKAYKEQSHPGLLLHRVTEFLNAEPFLKIARAMTGLEGIERVSAQATCFRPGHFLRMHTDAQSNEGRLAAYVINLTPAWQADCGGLLHFVDGNNQVESVFFPRFNSLSLFKVPRWHFVSQVTPYANHPRYAITGWFQTMGDGK